MLAPKRSLFALVILALSACSGNNNPILTPGPVKTAPPTAPSSTSPSTSPTATVKPTTPPSVAPTASPTAVAATPTPTPTPTAVPTPTNVLVDGTFETEGAANMTFSSWVPCSYPHPVASSSPTAAISSGITASVISTSDPSFTVGKASAPIATVTPAPDNGTYAALVYTGTGAVSAVFPPATAPALPAGSSGYPNTGADGICQSFTVPQNASLTLDVNTGGDESALKYGDQEATLFAGTTADLATATPITVFQELNTQNMSTYVPGYVAMGPYLLTGAPYNLAPGSTATLFLGTFDTEPSTTYGEYMFVDNVSVFGTPVTPLLRRTSFARAR